MVVNNKGEAQYFTLHPKSKGKKRKYSSEREYAGIDIFNDTMCEHWDNG